MADNLDLDLDLDLEVPGEEESLEKDDAAAQGAEGEGEGEKDADGKPADGGEKKPATLFEGNKLSGAAKSALAELKAKDPGIAKAVTRALYRTLELDREFPGGLTEVKELRDKLDGFGGVPGIEKMQQGLAEMDGLAKQFMDGDPAFVEDLATEGPEAFAKLAPAIFAKYAEVHPEGFEAYLGRVIYGDMVRNEIPLLMMRLADVIGDKPQAVEVFEKLNLYLGNFKTMATKPMEAPKGRAPEPKANNQDQREEDLRSREWKMDRDKVQRATVDSEFRSALNGRKPSSEERAEIYERFKVKAGMLLRNIEPEWTKKSERFIKNNDKAGYLRFMTSLYKRVTPESMSYAVNRTLKPARAGATAAPKKNEQPGRASGAPAAPGFTPVSKEPGSYEIDYSRTSTAMLNRNQAVLTDGRKVNWK